MSSAGFEDPEQAEFDELADSLHSMVTAAYGASAARDIVDDRADFNVQNWRQLAKEFNFFGLHLPEDQGGQGQSFLYSALAARAVGKAVLPGPYTAAISLAAPLLSQCGSVQQRERLLAPLLNGDLIITAGSFDHVLTRKDSLTVYHAEGKLTGQLHSVHFADIADGLVLDAINKSTGAIETFYVPLDASGIAIDRQAAVDLTRSQWTVSLDAATGEAITCPSSDAKRYAFVQAAVLIASESLGGARQAFDMALDYAKVRRQFDRPIGSFQALQHKFVDLFAELETAQASVEWAARLVDSWHDGARLGDVIHAASVAKAAAAEASCHVTREVIHLHGGIGFTWEHDAHLYFKRAMTDRQVLGNPRIYRQLIADQLAQELVQHSKETVQ